MAFNVQQFRASLVNDGARASLFDITMNMPPAPGITPLTSAAITFKARASSLPGDSISSISVPYFGREIKVAGTRTFPDWSFTVINDENFLIRNNLELWMSALNAHVLNVRNPVLATMRTYQADAMVTQYAKTGEIIKQYKLIGCFPTDVSAIDLDWASGDQIEEFTATFSYQWWESAFPVQTTDVSGA
jgi:hypothetical protein